MGVPLHKPEMFGDSWTIQTHERRQQPKNHTKITKYWAENITIEPNKNQISEQNNSNLWSRNQHNKA